jgi:hypothetical protein
MTYLFDSNANYMSKRPFILLGLLIAPLLLLVIAAIARELRQPSVAWLFSVLGITIWVPILIWVFRSTSTINEVAMWGLATLFLLNCAFIPLGAVLLGNEKADHLRTFRYIIQIRGLSLKNTYYLPYWVHIVQILSFVGMFLCSAVWVLTFRVENLVTHIPEPEITSDEEQKGTGIRQ